MVNFFNQLNIVVSEYLKTKVVVTLKNLKMIYTLPNTKKKINTLERHCSNISIPSSLIPEDKDLFISTKKGLMINIPFLREHFISEGRLTTSQVLGILKEGTALLKEEDNLLHLSSKPAITICGDVHGQFYDLMKLFEIAGGDTNQNPKTRFLFLGDYVDRGIFSLETYLFILSLKINDPQRIHMLRGNHECRHLTKHFTFKLECSHKNSEEVWEKSCESFDALPLAAVVNNQLFCVHGGICPSLKSPEDVNSFDRFKELPKTGIYCDLLWSDPADESGFNSSQGKGYSHNSQRGCSYRYSGKAAEEFLSNNGLLTIIRGHEAQQEGYKFHNYTLGQKDFPSVITLFSAPNYCDVYGNKGAIINYDGDILNIRQFTSTVHPYHLPKFMNVFDWSLPFVAEKVTMVLEAVLGIPSLSEGLECLTERERDVIELNSQRQKNVLKKKIMAVGRLGKMFTTIREERENLSELMDVMGVDRLPSKYLTLGGEDLRKTIHSFKEAQKCDSLNELLPLSDEGMALKSLKAIEDNNDNDNNNNNNDDDDLKFISDIQPIIGGIGKDENESL